MYFLGNRLKKDAQNSLKKEIRHQWHLVFGRRRYWFHIAIWIIVAGLTVIQTSDLALGYRIGTSTVFTGRDTSTMVEIRMHEKELKGKEGGDYSKRMRSVDQLFSGRNRFFPILIGALIGGVMVYFFLLLVIPFARLRQQKRILILGVLVNLVLFLVTLFVTGVIAGYLAGRGVTGKDIIVANIVVYVTLAAAYSLLVTGYFFSIYYFIDLYDEQRYVNRFAKVFTEKLHAETAFLKTQINPHFLFNTLNNIYGLSLDRPGEAAMITGQLKELIQYMLDDCRRDDVPRSGELNFIRNYIDLEKLRNVRDHTVIDFRVTGHLTDGLNIAPLLLINFIENAFKHGVKSGIEKSFVIISISVAGRNITMEIVNSKPVPAHDPEMSVKQEGGIGIKNVTRRLEILYPRRYRLKIKETDKEYSVYLNVEL